VSPVQHRNRLDSLLAALRNLTGRGLTAGAVLAFLHHRRVVPLMERPLRIFEMMETANPVALARSRMLQSPLLREYAATRAQSAIDTRSLRSDRSLWDLEMLPTGLLVSGILGSVFDFAVSLGCWRASMFRSQLVSLSAAKSDPPTPRSRALGRAAQQRERERAARKKEHAKRHRERRERRNEEYRLREQQGLSLWGLRSTRPRRKRSGGRASLIGGSLRPRRRSQLRRQE
jgi:hypothetical protein